MKKVIVLGTNHAGTAAVNTMLDNSGDELEVVTYDQNDNISFLGCGIALWVQGVVKDSKGLFYSSPKLLQDKGAKVFMNHKALSIDEKNKKIRVKNLKTNEEFEDNYDVLVIAVGSQTIMPKISGTDLDNVTSIKFFQDGQYAIEKFKDKNIKNVCIVGAGYIGLELAEAYHLGGKNVHVIDRSQDIVSKYYDKKFRTELKERMIKNGIHMHLGEELKQIKGKDGTATAVVTDKGEYKAELVILSIGFRPNDELYANLKIDKFPNGAIKVDKHQRTSQKDIYAIGDCATVFDTAQQKHAYIALASNAIRSGIACGFAISQKPLDFEGVQGSNAINVFSLCLCSTGLTKEVATSCGFDPVAVDITDKQLPDFMPNNYNVSLSIVFDIKSWRILGAQIMSEKDVNNLIHTFSLAIFKKVTIDELKLFDMFFLPHFNQPLSYVLKAALSEETNC